MNLMLRSSFLLMAVTSFAFAQPYPSKPTRIVAGFTAGGPSAIVARHVAQQLTERLRKTCIADNRDGATGTVVATLVASAPKDEVDVRTLSMRWPGAPTPKVRADRFATIAETKGTFDAGTYVLHVTSEAGVRVTVAGKTVLEDWR